MKKTAYRIKTERTVIRCFDPKDAYMLKSTIDESLDHLSKWLPWTKGEPEEIDKKIERLRINRAEFDLDKNYAYGIFDHDETKLIGTIALKKMTGDEALEIGYWVHKEYMNKGYITEASSALVRISFDVENVERVEIHCDPRNNPSAAIPKKLGFDKEAVIRRNELDKNGTRLQSMIWVMFKDKYKESNLVSYPITVFDVIGRKILG